MGTWKKLAYADDVILKALLTEQGDIIYASAASTPAALPHGTSGQYLKSGGDAANPSWDTPAGGGPTIVLKTADETVNNSANLQNDDHLLLTIAANERWLIEVTLLLKAASVSNFKFGWSYPTDCLIYWGRLAADTSSASASDWMGTTSLTTNPSALLIQTNTLAIGGGNNVIHGLILRAIVINGANGGFLTLQWAQNTAVVEDTQILANSCLIAHKLG